MKWYKFARTVCTERINHPDNTPKPGGKIDEFDESFALVNLSIIAGAV